MESPDLDPNLAKQLAVQWINEHFPHPKVITRPYATATYWTTTDGPFAQWQPFNKEHNLRWLLTDTDFELCRNAVGPIQSGVGR
jgi:hypothetical protein